MKEGNEDTFQCHFVSKNTKFVVGIEYPDEADWFIGGGDDIEDGLIEVDCHVPHHQGNLLRGIDNYSGAARYVVEVH
jgi:hypothetical protein